MWRNIVKIVFAAAILGYYFNKSDTDYVITENIEAEYDYIIVGGGTAGCVLANRLSEDPNMKILLLEAGGKDTDNANVDIPAASYLLRNSKQDWQYKTVPQNNSCYACKGRQSSWTRGKMLGGSSSLNFMAYARGNKADFDLWETLGAAGWGFKDVLPYFQKAENNHNAEYVKSGYHGGDGPWPVSNAYYTHLSDVFISGAKELGLEEGNSNGENQFTVMKPLSNIKDGTRWSTSKAYLKPATRRLNLHVAINARVIKINLVNRRAVGVTFIHSSQKKVVMVRQEVILSAGAISSPQILMLSGIGPEQQLEKVNIDPLITLPVGEYMQDHSAIFLPEVFVNQSLKPTLNSISTYLNYKLFSSGLLSTNLNDGLMFLKTNHSSTKHNVPDILIEVLSFALGESGNDKDIEKTTGFSKDFVQKYQFSEHSNGPVFSFLVLLLHPKSIGSLYLRSRDPFDSPVIDPNYYKEEVDVKMLVDGIKYSLKFLETKAFQAIGSRLREQKVPGCETLQEDEYWACCVRTMATSINHATGTCKMGDVNDPTAVVDPELKVKGVEALRVVDASIMPSTISGGIHPTVIMIAEKAADMIKNLVD